MGNLTITADGFFLIGIVVAIIIAVSYWVVSIIEKQKKKVAKSNVKYENSANTYTKWNNWGTPTESQFSEVDAEIEEVIKWIGVSEPVDDETLVKKIIDGKEKEAIDDIARQLSLPMKITIKHSDEGYVTNLAEVKVGDIPGYGSKYLESYPCTITLYPGYNASPDRLISVIAHELSHYVLRTLRPSLPDKTKEERQTDLAVIFGGFKTSYSLGRNVYNEGTAGYLLDNEIHHIYGVYEAKLADRRQKFKQIKKDYEAVLKDQSNVLLFTKLCKILIDHPGEKITKVDMESVGRCLSATGKKEIDKIDKITESLKPFLTKRTRYSEMKNDEENLAELKKILKGINLPEVSDISVLTKYANKYLN